MIVATRPDPTVRPPSRIAKRSPCSIANWMDQFNCHFYVISRHAHFCSFRKFANTCYVCCSEVELRTVVVEEWSMTSTFIFCQNVNLSCKFVVACYRTWFTKNLSSFDFCSLNTTKQSTDVVTSLSFIKRSLRNISTPVTTTLRVSSWIPTISTSSDT